MDIDGKRLFWENELKKAVEKVIKDGKNPGYRTVAGRIKESIMGCYGLFCVWLLLYYRKYKKYFMFA